ncbi:sigma-70 family RNA polymerase sigma factor [Paenibacillaceae bacterium]|nr:sigma-70 family RNA polymerase sigma factor [Paenibacillaceae bacterium]
MQTDEQLLKEIRQGIQSAMEVLVRRHYQTVFAFIYRQIGDYHLSYDLTQETFIKMVRNAQFVDQTDRFQHWLIKIALNTCRDYFKSKGYKTARSSQPWPERFDPGDESIIDLFERKTDSALVKEALLTLPEQQRESIVLRFYHDLKIKEIAALTSAPEPTVKSRIKQGMMKLKSIFERSSDHDQEERQRR